jgi:hypothetical protein
MNGGKRYTGIQMPIQKKEEIRIQHVDLAHNTQVLKP